MKNFAYALLIAVAIVALPLAGCGSDTVPFEEESTSPQVREHEDAAPADGKKLPGRVNEKSKSFSRPASSANAATARFAQAWLNWDAGTLGTRTKELRSIATGPALILGQAAGDRDSRRRARQYGLGSRGRLLANGLRGRHNRAIGYVLLESTPIQDWRPRRQDTSRQPYRVKVVRTQHGWLVSRWELTG